MIRFVLTTHEWLPGARLSRVGHYGNVPFDDADAARAAAAEEADGREHTIEREHHRAKGRKA